MDMLERGLLNSLRCEGDEIIRVLITPVIVITAGSILVTPGSVSVTPGSVVVTPGSVVVTPGSYSYYYWGCLSRGFVCVTKGVLGFQGDKKGGKQGLKCLGLLVPPNGNHPMISRSPPVKRALSSRLRLQHLKKVWVQRKDSNISFRIGLDEEVDIEIVCKAIVIPGRVLVPPGSVVVPTGSVVVPTGSVVVPTGSVVVPTSPPVRRALSSRLRLQHLKKVRVQRKDSDISSGIGLDEEVDIEIVCKAIVIPGRVLVPPGSVVVPPGSVVVPTGSVITTGSILVTPALDDGAVLVKRCGYFFLNWSSRSHVNSGPLLEFHRTLINGMRLHFNRLTSLSMISTDLIVQQYEQFTILEEESIDNAFARSITIITSLKALDEGFSSKNCVRKFLRALHPKWRAKVTAIEESKDLTSLSLDELIGNLKVYEVIIKKEFRNGQGQRENVDLCVERPKGKSSDEDSSELPNSERRRIMTMSIKEFKKILQITSRKDSPRTTT
ncbi:hypothetical protein Tco_0162446 [Tanacetum coccineum]